MARTRGSRPLSVLAPFPVWIASGEFNRGQEEALRDGPHEGIERHRMNDQERLKVLLDTLQQLDGLDAERFQRLTAELQRHRNRDGCDEQERLKATLFDAKSYDIDSFERHNNGHHAIRYVAASLNRDTVRAASRIESRMHLCQRHLYGVSREGTSVTWCRTDCAALRRL